MVSAALRRSNNFLESVLVAEQQLRAVNESDPFINRLMNETTVLLPCFHQHTPNINLRGFITVLQSSAPVLQSVETKIILI